MIDIYNVAKLVDNRDFLNSYPSKAVLKNITDAAMIPLILLTLARLQCYL
jgi:hypothetical protein